MGKVSSILHKWIYSPRADIAELQGIHTVSIYSPHHSIIKGIVN